MRLGLLGGALPSEALGEDTRLRSKTLDQFARFSNAPHRRGHGADVAMGHEEPRVAVAHGFANARRVRCDDGSSAGGGFEIGNAPTLLWRRKNQCPRSAQQRELVRFGDSPKKPHALA